MNPVMTIEEKIANEIELYRTWNQYVRIGSFDIAEDHLRDFQEKINGLNNKAAKYETRPVVIKVLGSRMKRQDVFADRQDIRPVKRMIRVFRVVLFGETPKINGWEFAATIQHVTEGENIVRSIPGAPEVPASFFKVAPICDHCKTNRTRKDTFIVRNLADGTWKQVGKSCLRDFTGINNPGMIAFRMQFHEQILEVSREFSNREGRSFAYSTVEFLSYVSAVSAKWGFVSRAKADEIGGSTTGQTAFNYLVRAEGIKAGTESDSWRDPLPQITPADTAKAEAVIAWVRSGMDTPEPARDNFQRNLIATLRIDNVTHREIGIAAAAFQVYAKAQEKKLAAETTPSEYVGTVGKRQQFTDLTCTFIKEIPSYYGSKFLTKFQDASGNVLVWFSSGAMLAQGCTYSGKATVDEHSEYNGVKQTVLKRCDFQENGTLKVKRDQFVEMKDGTLLEVTRATATQIEGMDITGHSRYYPINDAVRIVPSEEVPAEFKPESYVAGTRIALPNGEIVTLMFQSDLYSRNFWNCKDDQGRISSHFVIGCKIIPSNQ